MQVIKGTMSFCPECYKRIPAIIGIQNGSIWMEKNCSEHGFFSAMVERDVDFYLKCLNADRHQIYNGYSVEITDRCNLNCEFCYYKKDNASKDRSIESILQEVEMVKHFAPIILTGGEPTIRKDFPELIEAIQSISPGVEMLTNGVAVDKAMLDKLCPLLACGDGSTRIHLSMHKDANGKDIELLKLCRESGVKLESILIEPISNLSQIE